jgi:hypothetical protein
MIVKKKIKINANFPSISDGPKNMEKIELLKTQEKND